MGPIVTPRTPGASKARGERDGDHGSGCDHAGGAFPHPEGAKSDVRSRSPAHARARFTDDPRPGLPGRSAP